MKASTFIVMLLVALPCLALATPVPPTGQTKCYDNTQEIACPNPGEPFYGQDAHYISNPQSYTKLDANGNDLPDDAPWPWAMVRDNVTGLIWEVKTDDGSIHDKDNTYNWYGAQDVFIATLNNENFGGYADWRLPTVKELSFIRDMDTYNPFINTAYFYHTTLDVSYWSSTTSVYNLVEAWLVNFYDAGVGTNRRVYDYYVQAVRGEQSFNNFIDNGDGTVTDTSTGLMWQKDTAPGIPGQNSGYNWQQALSYCEDLLLAGYDDWRLPNVNELQSIVDYSRSRPAIDTAFFPNTYYFSVSDYWSSTTYTVDPSYVPIVHFLDGMVWYDMYWDKTFPSIYVRAVRGGQCGALGDSDGDTVCNDTDNCIDDYNPTQEDKDTDGVGDACDTCPLHPNSPLLGTCIRTMWGKTCLSDQECSMSGLGVCSMDQSDNIDCDCKSNFDCDYDVDGTDAARFKADFGRSLFNHRCINQDPCKGDFECDGDVDGTDAADFKRYFGITPFSGYCLACVDGVYQYSCSY